MPSPLRWWQQAGAAAQAADALAGTASATDMAYLTGTGFQMAGKGLQIMTIVKTISDVEAKAEMA